MVYIIFFLHCFTLVFLLMYINDKLIDQAILSYRAMQDPNLREAYVQGAIKEMLEKWEDLIKDQDLKPDFYIKSNTFDRINSPG